MEASPLPWKLSTFFLLDASITSMKASIVAAAERGSQNQNGGPCFRSQGELGAEKGAITLRAWEGCFIKETGSSP